MPKMTEEQKATRKAKKDWDTITSTLEATLEDCKQRRNVLPTVFYEVGDRVRYGNWDWSGVLEVCENGLYYKLFSVTWNTGRNVRDHGDWKIHYEVWHHFQPYITREENDSRDIFTQDDDIHIQYQQRDMYSLLNYYFNRYGIDLEPEYQRGNVWTPEQKVKLIDSIYHNVDIGKFAIIKRNWGSNSNEPAQPQLYEMLDGKQRLTALIEFFTGQFKYKGKYYHELCWTDKNQFKNYHISVAETSPLTNAQKYRYFLKLNTTGTPVCKNHMERVAGMLQKEIDNVV